MKEIVFVIGVGRSGTTLLQSMLHANSNIHFSKETHFIKRYVEPEIKSQKYNWNDVIDFKKAIDRDENLFDFKSQTDEILKQCVKSKNNQYLTVCFFENLFSSTIKKRYIGDKDPMNVNFLPIISKGFPNAKIVNIIRDPRDVILSRIKSGWGKGSSLIWHTSEYKYSITKARKEGITFFKNNYMEIKYESLLKNPEIELKKICDFLNVDFEEKMLSFYLNADTLIRKEEADWKSNVLNPLDQNKIGQWKKQLSASQIGTIEIVLGDTIDQLGYVKSEIVATLRNKLYLFLSHFITLIFKVKFG